MKTRTSTTILVMNNNQYSYELATKFIDPVVHNLGNKM